MVLNLRCAGAHTERRATAGLLASRRLASVVPPVIAHAVCFVQFAPMPRLLRACSRAQEASCSKVCDLLVLTALAMAAGRQEYDRLLPCREVVDNSALHAGSFGRDVNLTLPWAR